jgi:hypothetical protein
MNCNLDKIVIFSKRRRFHHTSPMEGPPYRGPSLRLLTRDEARRMAVKFARLPRCEAQGAIVREGTQPHLGVSRASLAENKMHAFLKRFLMHYGIYRRYPLGRFPALRNAWRAAQP